MTYSNQLRLLIIDIRIKYKNHVVKDLERHTMILAYTLIHYKGRYSYQLSQDFLIA